MMDLVSQRAKRSGRLGPGGGILSQSQVFGHQGGPEASFVVITANIPNLASVANG